MTQFPISLSLLQNNLDSRVVSLVAVKHWLRLQFIGNKLQLNAISDRNVRYRQSIIKLCFQLNSRTLDGINSVYHKKFWPRQCCVMLWLGTDHVLQAILASINVSVLLEQSWRTPIGNEALLLFLYLPGIMHIGFGVILSCIKLFVDILQTYMNGLERQSVRHNINKGNLGDSNAAYI